MMKSILLLTFLLIGCSNLYALERGRSVLPSFGGPSPSLPQIVGGPQNPFAPDIFGPTDPGPKPEIVNPYAHDSECKAGCVTVNVTVTNSGNGNGNSGDGNGSDNGGDNEGGDNGVDDENDDGMRVNPEYLAGYNFFVSDFHNRQYGDELESNYDFLLENKFHSVAVAGKGEVVSDETHKNINYYLEEGELVFSRNVFSVINFTINSRSINTRMADKIKEVCARKKSNIYKVSIECIKKQVTLLR